eukprot:1144208-Pelagomonas_calceolata.AAC.7
MSLLGDEKGTHAQIAPAVTADMKGACDALPPSCMHRVGAAPVSNCLCGTMHRDDHGDACGYGNLAPASGAQACNHVRCIRDRRHAFPLKKEAEVPGIVVDHVEGDNERHLRFELTGLPGIGLILGGAISFGLCVREQQGRGGWTGGHPVGDGAPVCL